MLTAKRLREVLHYDPETGVFTWLISTSNKSVEGDIAGYVELKGYIVIRIAGKRYKAHRLAWLYMTGKWPVDQIDHRDTNKTNNCFTNLREATHSINQQNQRLANKNNKLGILGVVKRGNKFRVEIQVDSKLKFVGSFNTPEQAHAAYIEAKRKHHPGCTL